MNSENTPALRKALKFVAFANFLYFFVEFFVALKINSVSLFADSVDFLEDASVNFIIIFAIGWSLKARAKVGMVLAALLVWPALATAWMIWNKINGITTPEPFILTATGFGALCVNVTCAFMLTKFRSCSGSLTKAAFYSARNDAIANIAIMFAGGLTALTHSGIPDLVVGVAIAAMNIGAAKEVWEAAKKEKLEAHEHHC